MLLGNNPFPQDARVEREARSLVEAGYRVAVISPRVAGQPGRERLRGVDVYRYRQWFEARGTVGYAIEYLQATAAALVLSVRAVLAGGFDVLHAHNPPDTYWLVAAVWKPFRKRFVYDQHDIAPEMYAARFPDGHSQSVQRILLRLERLTYRLADHVIVTNESYRRIAIERGEVRPESVSVVRNGPEIQEFHPVEPDPELRARAGTILGYLGVMGYQDGLDHLLRALHHLVYDLKRTDVLAVLIGAGDALDEMRRLARKLDLEQCVWFTGWQSQSDLVRLLSTVDICLDPDPSNPFTDSSTMVKVAEYMALGKPIVAFDLPEHKVTAGEAALYVQPNDDLEFARAIAELIDDPEGRASMGRIGRDRVEQGLAWNHSVPHLLEVYERLFGEGRS